MIEKRNLFPENAERINATVSPVEGFFNIFTAAMYGEELEDFFSDRFSESDSGVWRPCDDSDDEVLIDLSKFEEFEDIKRVPAIIATVDGESAIIFPWDAQEDACNSWSYMMECIGLDKEREDVPLIKSPYVSNGGSIFQLDVETYGGGR